MILTTIIKWLEGKFLVKNNCGQIEIAVPGSNLEQELQKNKCNILTKNSGDMQTNRVISLPEVKTLLYGISKTGLPMIGNVRNVGEAAITADVLLTLKF